MGGFGKGEEEAREGSLFSGATSSCFYLINCKFTLLQLLSKTVNLLEDLAKNAWILIQNSDWESLASKFLTIYILIQNFDWESLASKFLTIYIVRYVK